MRKESGTAARRSAAGCVAAFGRKPLDELHLVHYAPLALAQIVARVGRIVDKRVGQRRRYEGALAPGEVFRRRAEVPLGHGRRPVDAVAHLDGVEVDLHYALLAPHQLDEGGEVSLQPFPHPCAARPEEHVLGRLLRDGARAHLALALAPDVVLGGLLYGAEVEAVVRKELGVLAGHDCLRQVWRHILERHPPVVELKALAALALLDEADEHERREVDRDETQQHDSKDGGAEEGHHHPF